MDKEVKTQQINLIDLIPKRWIDNDGNVDLWVSAYFCWSSTVVDTTSYRCDEIEDVFYLLAHTQQEYFDVDLSYVGDDGKELSFNHKLNVKKTPAGLHLIFYTPSGGKSGVSEAEANAKMEVARGLVLACEGENATYVHLYSQELQLPTGRINMRGPVFVNPLTSPMPFQDKNRLVVASKNLSKLEANTKARVNLALRWMDKSASERDHIDSFLKIWFALETIAMPNTTNIKPLIQAMASIYGVTYQEAISVFEIGRIQDLRASIVHNGIVPIIHYQLLNYLSAIFSDLLFNLLGMQSERRALGALSNPQFAQMDWRP